MSLKDLTLNELYERLCGLRGNSGYRPSAKEKLEENSIIEELERREGERDR